MAIKQIFLSTLIAGLIALIPGTDIAGTPASPFTQDWIDGTHADEPRMQVQRYDSNTYVIRQSVLTNFEAPFLYLLFGTDRALLLDTGAGGLDIRPTIDHVIEQWLAQNHRTSIPLVVAHSHAHRDHRMGDEEFKGRPDTTVVGLSPSEVASYFQIAHWPSEIVQFDLGGRVFDIIPAPGHQTAHIILFDRSTRLLLSGDSLYPGRLYVPLNHIADYRKSIDRVVNFTRSRHVSYILGAHIEMTRTPGKDYSAGAPAHSNEHRLELPYASLLELQNGLRSIGEPSAQKVQVHDDFIVVPVAPRQD